MSAKNEAVLNNIATTNYLQYSKEAIIASMLRMEIAGQRVFYMYLSQKGLNIKPEDMDKRQSDGIIGNANIECKLTEKEGGGPGKAYKELFTIIPNRLKGKGERLPYYRIYVELETFLVEVYDPDSNLVDTFDWFDEPMNFEKYFKDEKKVIEYDLEDPDVDLVEVIQNLYTIYSLKDKMAAFKKLKEGIPGWFKPFDITKVDINRLILNNDKMNEKFVQKNEGAFFTPPQYVKRSTTYIENAIEQSIKDGYDDYVIVDRCAGVGNLESQFKEDVYSHLILGTLNDAEAFTANIRFNGKVSVHVIDGLSEEGIKYYQDQIEQYCIMNKVKKLAIIFLENPPYANQGSNVGVKMDKNKEKSFVHGKMPTGSGKQDLYNQFLWSAWKIFNPYNYILYSPIKYWKLIHLEPRKFIEGTLCDAKEFNASKTRGISLIHWDNKEDKVTKEIELETLDGQKITIRKIEKGITPYQKDDENAFVKMTIVSPTTFTNAISNTIFCDLNFHHNVGGKHSSVGSDNMLSQLPLYVLNLKAPSIYTEMDVLMKSSDGNSSYLKDTDFLQHCLLYALVAPGNKCSHDNNFWEIGEKELSDELKKTDIWKAYKELSIDTKLNGLRAIGNFQDRARGKLWEFHNFKPRVKLLKEILQKFYDEVLRPGFLKHELLK